MLIVGVRRSAGEPTSRPEVASAVRRSAIVAVDGADDDFDLEVINGVMVRHDRFSHPFAEEEEERCPADVFAPFR